MVFHPLGGKIERSGRQMPLTEIRLLDALRFIVVLPFLYEELTIYQMRS